MQAIIHKHSKPQIPAVVQKLTGAIAFIASCTARQTTSPPTTSLCNWVTVVVPRAEKAVALAAIPLSDCVATGITVWKLSMIFWTLVVETGVESVTTVVNMLILSICPGDYL